MFCDLHVHSTFSDGTFTPTELIEKAESIGLKALALCDHNTVDGLGEFVGSGKNSSVITIPGIEISTEYQKTELHILALFLPEDKYSDVSQLMERTKELKQKSNADLIRRLCDAGYFVDYDKIKRENKDSYINRAHIAQALTDSGYTTSIGEAFETLLNPANGYYVEPPRLSALDTIEFINSIGAVSVWAHPFLKSSRDIAEAFLPLAKERGLCAIETMYSEYSPATQQKAQELCRKYDLAQSGGSDFHGLRKPDIELGTGKGNLAIPFEFYTNLAI